MLTNDQQERLSASLQKDIDLIYKAAYHLPDSDGREVLLCMLAILQGKVSKGLGHNQYR